MFGLGFRVTEAKPSFKFLLPKARGHKTRKTKMQQKFPLSKFNKLGSSFPNRSLPGALVPFNTSDRLHGKSKRCSLVEQGKYLCTDTAPSR